MSKLRVKKTVAEEQSASKEEQNRFGLPMMLAVSVGIALALTVTSIGLYYSSNLSRIDLSKPRYADVRVAIEPAHEDSETEQFDVSSPITEESVKRTLEEMQTRQNALRGLGNFSSPILSDTALGLSE